MEKIKKNSMTEKLTVILQSYEELIKEITIENGYQNSRLMIVEILETENFFKINLDDTTFSETEKSAYEHKLKMLGSKLTPEELEEIKPELIRILQVSPPFTYKGGKMKAVQTEETAMLSESAESAEESIIIKGEKFYAVKLFFGTDRNTTNSQNINEKFNGERSTTGITYGVCSVSVPLDHEAGEIERPKFWKLQFKEDPAKHISILDLIIKDKDDFKSLIEYYRNILSNNDVLVFVHGYNVSFADSARRAAQITFDLEFTGYSFFYSWPSDGNLKGYLGDRDDSEWSIDNLKEFLVNIINWTGVNNGGNLHIIAHSMGTNTASKAIIETEIEFKGKVFFHNIILAAADIDKDIFIDRIVPKFLSAKLQRRVTLYASAKDKALLVSKDIRFNKISRAGEGGRSLILMDGIDSVDASNVDTDFMGHGYFAGNTTLLKDIKKIIKEDLAPSLRGLSQKERNKKTYWEINE